MSSNVTFNYTETTATGLFNEGAGDIINGGYFNSLSDFSTGNAKGLGATDVLKLLMHPFLIMDYQIQLSNVTINATMEIHLLLQIL